MSPSEADLKVESRLTRLETTVDTIAGQVQKTSSTVDRLAMLATGDRRLVKGFVLALGIMWGLAQWAVPLLKDDGLGEVVTLLKQIQTQEQRIKTMEEWAARDRATLPVPAPVR